MKCNFFFKKSTEISSKTWKSTLKFFWNVLCHQWPQNLKVLGRNFLQIQQTTINSSMTGYVTRLIFFTFLDFDHLQGVEVAGTGGGSKLNQKKANFGCPVSVKIIQTLFVSAKLLSLMKILAKLDGIWGSKDPKTT